MGEGIKGELPVVRSKTTVTHSPKGEGTSYGREGGGGGEREMKLSTGTYIRRNELMMTIRQSHDHQVTTVVKIT